MSESYAELLDGITLVRPAPGARHEAITHRLHACVAAGIGNVAGTRLLGVRSEVLLSPAHAFRPDLAIVSAGTNRLWLAAEVISSADHRMDTVFKKQVYEELRVPRVWMVDPRYDNVEVYHGTSYGLALREILAGQEILSEKLLPEFQVTIADLFAVAAGA